MGKAGRALTLDEAHALQTDAKEDRHALHKRIAWLVDDEGANQAEIGRALNVSRQRVYIMLEKGRAAKLKTSETT